MRVVDQQIDSVGRPVQVYVVGLLLKTCSGNLLRRSIQLT